MSKAFKIIIGLFIGLVAIGVITTIALRYLDVILGFFQKREYIEDDCECCTEAFE
ncbi:MAG: hypothetical protein FWG36_05585 [Oscillospiraceae bacterium]|nr:hypothetical protein [Oscillospiraceae bacterium]